ncbi:MAG: amidohydrolase family protein, partial [Acidimicrobiia bacterium]
FPAGAPVKELPATLFGQLALTSCAEWIWSKCCVRHPELQIAMSEGGIGWVAMLHDRLENIVDRSGYGRYFQSQDLRPAEVLHRNFWFCTIDDPSTLATLETIGVDRVMFETDYPHGDGTWPDSQAVFDDVFGSLPADVVAKIGHENAAALFRHPLPPADSPFGISLRRADADTINGRGRPSTPP